MRSNPWRPLAFLLFALLAGAPRAAAADFRIETKVFAGDDDAEPASTNITLFHGGVVYDFLDDPAQIAIFKKLHNSASGRFILLDTNRKIRTELTTERILEYTSHLQGWASKRDNALLKFASAPKFREEFDAESGELALVSPALAYRLRVEQSPGEEASAQYRDFSDWYARLGAVVHPGPIPPFPRLALNAVLAKNNVIPTAVRLELPSSDGKKSDLVMRTEHQLIWRLSKADTTRIDQANKHLVTYSQVELAEFRRE